MATEIDKLTGEITTDDNWFWVVKDDIEALVKVEYSTVGTDGTVTIKDAQSKAYRNSDDTSDLVVNFDSTVTSYVVFPTGGRINFTTEDLVSGSSGVTIKVIQQKTR